MPWPKCPHHLQNPSKKNPNRLISGKLQQSTGKISALSQVNNSQHLHSALEQIKKNYEKIHK